MSTAPPMQPPWMAAITGMRALSSAVKLSCSISAVSRRRARWRPASADRFFSPSPEPPPEPTSLPPVNTARSMPAEKCLPVEDKTMARAQPSALMPLMISGSSIQNAGTMVLSSSGRLSCTWATWSLSLTSKQVYPMGPRLRAGRVAVLGDGVELEVLLAGVGPVLELDHPDLLEPVAQPLVAGVEQP